MARPNNAPDVFRAVAHPVWRRILDLLRNKPQTVGELHAQFRLGGSTFSEHLRALRAAGLVRQSKRGPSLIYSIVPGQLGPIVRWIRQHAN